MKKVISAFLQMEYTQFTSIPKGRINRVLAIDFETANEDQRSICSLGIALAEDNEIVFNKEFLINPEEEFDPYNIKIHNITD